MTESDPILIVEDEPAIRLALRGLLRRDGYTVLEAASGPEALTHLEPTSPAAPRPRLVLTDLSLGEDMTGMDVLRAAKRSDPAPAVLMITAYGSEHVARDAVAAGADGYVPKPFNNDEILAAVREALERVRAR